MRGSNTVAIGGFSLTEVVLALGICTFVLISLIGLFNVGWRSSRESEEQIQAANLASRLIALRTASPTNGFSTSEGIPYDKMTQAYGNAFSGDSAYITESGLVTTAITTNSIYRITCRVGTNAETGPDLAQVFLKLSWPPQALGASEAGRYEIFTYVSLK